MVPSGKSYQFSYEGGLPKTELPAESHQGDQKALGLTIINMIDNVVAKSETVSVNTHDPFVAEIAYRYLMNLKSKGINVEFVVQFKDQKFTSSTLYNDSINEILKTLPAVSFSTNSPEDSWEKEVKLEKRTKRVSEMLQKMKVEHDLDNNAGTPSSYNRP